MAPHCICIFIYYVHSSSFEDPISCLRTFLVYTYCKLYIHHTGPTAQINVDVVNFKEYIQIRVAKHIVFPSTSMTVSIASSYTMHLIIKQCYLIYIHY